MKDSKFIELLNLYVDHQISAADAALLEAEIQQNPARRKIYRQYCQMQKACSTLAENFRTQAPAVGGKIVEFPRTRSRWTAATYAAGALAAAACVALVVVNRDRFTAPAHVDRVANVIPAVEAPQPVMARTSEVPAAPVPARAALQPVFAGVVNDSASAEATLAAGERVPLDWMSRVNLEPVSIETLRFETGGARLRTESMMLRSTQRPHDEEIAWRFQR